MSALQAGGGSSAVAASAHAACQRFRHTDPLIIGVSRRQLATRLGHADTTAGIPDARWVRAMTFEGLVHDERFVSELLTTAVGRLGLDRPEAVRRADCRVDVAATATALDDAHRAAVDRREATMLTSLAVPFVGLEHADATPVKPDFAIVAPHTADEGTGSWLIMGDAKDYERVRSRIDDQRMLKGFLQVALGAESAEAWSLLPTGMHVHRSGALAVPRNAFLQPGAVVESLDDHRAEVLERAKERTDLLAELGTTPIPDDQLDDFVTHLQATFDPDSCPSCALFNACRSELRSSSDPADLLIELGVAPEDRRAALPLLDGESTPAAPASLVATVTASLTGVAQSTGQRRLDPAGLPGTVNVVLAKSDGAALGVHGIGLQSVDENGTGEWAFHAFDDPQSPMTRLAVMHLVGAALADHVDAEVSPVHLVVPDRVTADVLASIADSLAGVETSRLRWERDLEMGREALTFNGEPARVPDPLDRHQRLAVSFLLEEDRARAMTLRSPIVDLRAVVAQHFVPGGPTSDHGRLDYLVAWAAADAPVDHRAVSDQIAGRVETPGARLSNLRSNELFAIQPSARAIKEGRADRARYRDLVVAELQAKADTMTTAIDVLDALDDSVLRGMHRALEADAQAVWLRRLEFHASDLVRFGRTRRWWRNDQVNLLEGDRDCNAKLLAVGNPQAAHDLATDAGTRQVALATVTSLDPPRLRVASRRFGEGTVAVVVHRGDAVMVESDTVRPRIQGGSFKFERLVGGALEDDGGDDLRWNARSTGDLAVGDEVVVVDQAWMGGLNAAGTLKIDRPKLDKNSAPRPTCGPGAFAADPPSHQWCCKPHEANESEWADELAARRERGEMNPQTWPPVVDTDGFDIVATDAPTGDDVAVAASTAPADLTMDDLD